MIVPECPNCYSAAAVFVYRADDAGAAVSWICCAHDRAVICCAHDRAVYFVPVELEEVGRGA